MTRARLAALLAVFACLSVVGLACDDLLADTHRSRPRRRRNVPVAPVVPPVAPIAPGTPPVPPPPGINALLRVTFLDVGQGDAALLQSGDGHAALIDTGPPEARPRVRAALASHGVTRLDWMMLTHPHLDHIGGAINVLDTVPVGRVIDPAYPHPTATYDRLLARIQQLGLPFVRARTGTTLTLGGRVGVEILQPHEPFISRTRSAVNANSIVARVTAGAVRVLFAGDAERETEARLLAENAAQLPADVLKVAHHGSRYASTAALLAAVSPRYAVISCAPGNDYGHPHLQTLEALALRGVQIFRTDLQGDITLTTDGSQLFFTTARSTTPAALMTPGVPARRESD